MFFEHIGVKNTAVLQRRVSPAGSQRPLRSLLLILGFQERQARTRRRMRLIKKRPPVSEGRLKPQGIVLSRPQVGDTDS